MHLLELENPAFDNMFKAVYWAVVTLTTVGYGDAVPVSSAGQVLAAVTMTLGYTFVVLGLRHQIPLPVRFRLVAIFWPCKVWRMRSLAS